MTHRVPADLRERAVAAVEGEQRRAEVVRASGIAPRTVERWLARHRRVEALADHPRSGRSPKIAPGAYPALAAQVAAHADATLAVHGDHGATMSGVRVSRTTMGRMLARLDLPLKQSP